MSIKTVLLNVICWQYIFKYGFGCNLNEIIEWRQDLKLIKYNHQRGGVFGPKDELIFLCPEVVN